MGIALRVLIENPGMPLGDHPLSSVNPSAVDIRKIPSVAILRVWSDLSPHLEAESGQRMLRRLSMRLLELWGVDSTQPYLDGLERSRLPASYCQGIPVAYRDDQTEQSSSCTHAAQSCSNRRPQVQSHELATAHCHDRNSGFDAYSGGFTAVADAG